MLTAFVALLSAHASRAADPQPAAEPQPTTAPPLTAPPATKVSAAPIRAILELFVNTVDKGEANVAFEGKEVLVQASDLAAAGIVPKGGGKETIAGQDYFKLSSLAPVVTFAYDDQQLALRLTVNANALEANAFELRTVEAPQDLIHTESPSAFINYSVTGTNEAVPNLFAEQGVSMKGFFFDNTLSLPSRERLERGDTSLTYDDRSNLTRAVAGDVMSSGGQLGGTVTIGGLSFSHDFAIDPYFLPFPTQRYAGVVNTPSTADVYVNGQLVRTLTLPPGPFNLQDITGITGAGSTRVVIRNAFGQSQELGGTFYQSQSVLAQGLQQFNYQAGFVRNLSATSPLGAYGLPGFSAIHNYGLTDNLTVGGFVQAGPRVVVGGPQATLVLPIGQFSLGAAPSGAPGATGWSSALGYQYQSTYFNFGATGTYMSEHFANLGLTPADDRQRWQADAFSAVALGEWTALLQLQPGSDRDTGRDDQASLTISRRFTSDITLSLVTSQSRVEHQPVDTSIFLGLTVSLGHETTATASVTNSRDAFNSSAQIQRSLPTGPGYGYLLQGQTGRNSVNAADFQDQTTFGNYEVDATRSQGKNTLQYSASGALVAIGGDVKPSVALRDAYALIRVPDAANVTGYLSNQAIGKTDASGDLLVPNLISYYGNRVGIEEQDIPLDFRVDATELDVAPPYHGGAVVEFPVRRFQAFLGNIEVKTGSTTLVPVYGDMSLRANGKTYDSPVGTHGEFYFESIPPGTYPAKVAYDVRECDFDVTIPKSSDRFVKLGQLTCAAQ